MFGLSKRTRAAFEGSAYDNDNHIADLELDGSGKYEGKRKMWRFRLLNGNLTEDDSFQLEMGGRTKSARVTQFCSDGESGYVEFF